MQARIFGLLDMTATHLVTDRDIVPNRAQGYELEDGLLKNQNWIDPSFSQVGSGAFYSTVLDMAKWDAALYGTDILSQESKEALWTPLILSDGTTWPFTEAYGLGWLSGAVQGKNHFFVEHSGGWQGFSTHFLRFVDDHLSVVVLINSNHADSPEIAHQVARLVNPDLVIADEPRVTNLVNTLITDVFTGELKQAMFTPEGLAMGNELQVFFQENAALVGAVEKITLLAHPDAPDGYLVYLYGIKFENVDVQRLELVLTPEQKITSIRIK
jgi:CubicO group peptidase (beta-lactamase class C family)